MKKILFSIAMAFTTFTISAQCHLGGTLGFAIQNATYDGESESTSAIAFAPEFEYTINPKWSIGASIGVGYSSNTEITTISFSPYARLTFAQVGPHNKSVNSLINNELTDFSFRFINISKIEFHPIFTLLFL